MFDSLIFTFSISIWLNDYWLNIFQFHHHDCHDHYLIRSLMHLWENFVDVILAVTLLHWLFVTLFIWNSKPIVVLGGALGFEWWLTSSEKVRCAELYSVIGPGPVAKVGCLLFTNCFQFQDSNGSRFMVNSSSSLYNFIDTCQLWHCDANEASAWSLHYSLSLNGSWMSSLPATVVLYWL